VDAGQEIDQTVGLWTYFHANLGNQHEQHDEKFGASHGEAPFEY